MRLPLRSLGDRTARKRGSFDEVSRSRTFNFNLSSRRLVGMREEPALSEAPKKHELAAK